MIVATGGHVNHGKTALVRALTGADTDRLPEERRRGMTIDLGFAYRRSPAGHAIGIVDVPGDERFVRNMLAGVVGIDFILLVIAADDGPMPQTREHLAIVDLLDVHHGAVAISKIDRVPAARVQEVGVEVEALLAPTALADAPLFPLSAWTGEGVAELTAAIDRAARAFGDRPATGHFRLCVDRSFHLAGAGLVVTGTATSGEIAAGERVHAVVAGVEARVRSIRAHGVPATHGRAGQRLALNLAGAAASTAIARGDWVMAGAETPAVTRLDARLRVLPEQTLQHWTPVHVHIGAADVSGRVAVLGAGSVAPGASALVQLVLQRPVGALHGDRFIVRDQSARRTLGGGVVIDAFPPRPGRARPERLGDLVAMESEEHDAALAELAARAKAGIDLAWFAADRNLTTNGTERLLARSGLKRAGKWAFSATVWADLRRGLVAALKGWHEQAVDGAGMPVARLQEQGVVQLPEAVIAVLVGELAREGTIERDGAVVRLAGQRVPLSEGTRALRRDRGARVLRSHPVHAPGRGMHVLVRASHGKDTHPGGAPGLQIQ